MKEWRKMLCVLPVSLGVLADKVVEMKNVML
jgi:hypothetical protein